MTGQKRKPEHKHCQCPYCSGPTEASQPLCQVCGATIVRCRRCGRVLRQDEERCPGCGTTVEKAPRR